ncbi:TROVE domain-containing protein [Saccharothrix luteola]|uniref:TROVE domain-containing protein n=1 Tax=Saccharothrix luteola TaxID=2893018 RepID=UPI001E433085|nr:TROVE domain-containing protein [Saccharothrix luteola]MCC8250954.1 TROVE domain-containing protein [Saccharothrix luteola]
MSKFNFGRVRAAVAGPVVSEAVASGRTHEGAPGYAREPKSELFLLAVTNMVGEQTFYESAGERDDRYAALVRATTAADPDWTARFLAWLRGEANMRTAAIVGAAHFVKARLESGAPGMSRQVVDSVLHRADEPGELLAYWTSRHGRALPKPVKRGVGDAVRRLYDERASAKWDSEARGFRFADVLNLTHPTPRADWQGDLFTHILDRRNNRADGVPESLGVLRSRAELMAWPVERRRALFHEDRDTAAATLRAAGMTWESVAGWSQGPLTAEVWESLIPSMGYMALLRNLRNFDEAGVSDAVAEEVAARLADAGQVARSRQLPMRFLSAYRAAPSLRWAWALERAITHSLGNVPELPGRTLVLIDTSYSMNAPFAKDGTLMRWDAAAVFGIALGSRCEQADVVSFSNSTRQFRLSRGESLLKAVERWKSDGYFIGNGTATAHAVRSSFKRHDRVVIITDEQVGDGDVHRAMPDDVPLYTWNLAGYRFGHAPSGGIGGARDRYAFGGLTDQAFRMIPLLESGRDATWPF